MARPGIRSLLRSYWTQEQPDATPWQTPVDHVTATPALSTSAAAQSEPQHTIEDRAARALTAKETTAPSQPTQAADTQKPACDVGVVCAELPPEETLGLDATSQLASSTPLLDPSLTFRLHSNPTASKIIYLDFDGHTTSGTSWNTSTMGSSFYSPAFDTDGNATNFSTSELASIQQIWQRVVSNFSPFDVDVTTQAPPDDWLYKSSSTDANYGIRAVVTSYGPYSSSAGGIAYINSFSSNVDTPVYVYNRSVNGAAEGISHEVGHSLGLAHDGTASYEYYSGHGSGETGWAPIMGFSYNRNVTSWDDGTYTGSNNTGTSGNFGLGADDHAVIVGNNGFTYKPDYVGNTLANAAPLTMSSGTTSQYGTIETRLDSDWFSFQLLAQGDLNLTIDPYCYRAFIDADSSWGGSNTTYIAPSSDFDTGTPYSDNSANLDLEVGLYDSQGLLLLSSNEAGLATHLKATGLNAATYYLKVDGVGFGDPTSSTPTGYTDYGSIGDYWISGSISQAADNSGTGSTTIQQPRLSIADVKAIEGTSSSATIFQVQLQLDSASTNPVTVNYNTVDETAVSSGTTPDYNGLNGTVQFAPGITSATLAISVVADSKAESDESFLINFSNPTGSTLATNQARVTILNDDIISGGKTPKGKAKATLYSDSTLSGHLWDASPTPQNGDSLTGIPKSAISPEQPLHRQRSEFRQMPEAKASWNSPTWKESMTTAPATPLGWVQETHLSQQVGHDLQQRLGDFNHYGRGWL